MHADKNIKERIFLASPHMSEEGYEKKFVKEAFDTNWIAPLGKNVNEFEKEVCVKTGAKAAVALSSGTAAIHLALKLTGVKNGDLVFCSSLTFSASANPIIYEGGHDLVITMALSQEEGATIALVDENGIVVETERQNTEGFSYKILDDRFPFTINIGKVSEYYGFAVEIEEKSWVFSNQTEYNGYYFYSPYGKFTKIETAKTAIFTNYSKLASGRGYLWARTIPLLKDYLILGSGPDTFTVVFPQKDYVAASKMGYDKLTVTKPHDLYLQIGTQTGVLSLIAVLVFNVIYLWECLCLYWKRRANDFLQYMGMAIMIAVIGYLISGIINDSTITVAPIYWCLMGIGLAINHLVKCKRKEELN